MSPPTECSCVWRGRWSAPQGWVERIVRRDSGCPIHGDEGDRVEMPTERNAVTLRDREGVVHIAVRPNDADAWWTPIACGEGICLPGPQRSNRDQPATCPACRSSALDEQQERGDAALTGRSQRNDDRRTHAGQD